MTTSIKTCFKCGAVRPLTDFYRHPAMAVALHKQFGDIADDRD